MIGGFAHETNVGQTVWTLHVTAPTSGHVDEKERVATLIDTVDEFVCFDVLPGQQGAAAQHVGHEREHVGAVGPLREKRAYVVHGERRVATTRAAQHRFGVNGARHGGELVAQMRQHALDTHTAL